MLQLRDIEVLASVARYYTLTRGQMNRLHVATDSDGRITRKRLPGVSVAEWLSEWSIAKPDEKEPEKRYKLYCKLGQKLVCAPDAGFLLEKEGFRKVFYVEQHRDTTKNADRVAAQKCHGYAG